MKSFFYLPIFLVLLATLACQTTNEQVSSASIKELPSLEENQPYRSARSRKTLQIPSKQKGNNEEPSEEDWLKPSEHDQEREEQGNDFLRPELPSLQEDQPYPERKSSQISRTQKEKQKDREHYSEDPPSDLELFPESEEQPISSLASFEEEEEEKTAESLASSQRAKAQFLKEMNEDALLRANILTIRVLNESMAALHNYKGEGITLVCNRESNQFQIVTDEGLQKAWDLPEGVRFHHPQVQKQIRYLKKIRENSEGKREIEKVWLEYEEVKIPNGPDSYLVAALLLVTSDQRKSLVDIDRRTGIPSTIQLN
jgi:hypothetical protein